MSERLTRKEVLEKFFGPDGSTLFNAYMVEGRDDMIVIQDLEADDGVVWIVYRSEFPNQEG